MKTQKGDKIVEQSDDIEVAETDWGNGVVKKNIFLKESIRGKILVDEAELRQELETDQKLHPRWETAKQKFIKELLGE